MRSPLFLLALAAMPALANAQAPDRPPVLQASGRPQPVQLTSAIMAERSVTVNGRERVELSHPDKVVPGDRLVFETAFRNAGARPVTRFVVTSPIPVGVAYAGAYAGTYAGSGSAGPELSVDGGQSWGQLAALRIGTGKTTRAAMPSDVTDLRWVLASVSPGGSGTLRYRAGALTVP